MSQNFLQTGNKKSAFLIDRKLVPCKSQILYVRKNDKNGSITTKRTIKKTFSFDPIFLWCLKDICNLHSNLSRVTSELPDIAHGEKIVNYFKEKSIYYFLAEISTWYLWSCILEWAIVEIGGNYILERLNFKQDVLIL